MLEELIQNSILLSEEKKKETLEKVKNWTPEYRKRLEKIFLSEWDLITLLFKKYTQETWEDPIALLKWSYNSFSMKNIRDEEAKDKEWEILTLNF